MMTDTPMSLLSVGLRLLVTMLRVWRTLRPNDGHSVNQATEHMLYVLGLVNCNFGVVNIHAWILGFWDDLKDILG